MALAVLSILIARVVPPPSGLSSEGWLAAGLAVAMAILWLTEALPLGVTALIPLAVAPLLGISDLRMVAASYSHELVILFLGGFMIARAIERWHLHRRLASVLLGFAGDSPAGILSAIMLVTAFLSLWISNTASAMIVAPIAAAVAASTEDRGSFATALMLGVAYAATIGGMGSLIGTPPNAIFAAYMAETHGIEIGFVEWAIVGLPVSLNLLFLTWFVLAYVTPGVGSAPVALCQEPETPKASRGARRVAVVAGLTALAWLTRPVIEALLPWLDISDAGIAILAAVLLFALPSGEGGRLLDWEVATGLRWDVLILVGGGLALAGLIQQTGLAAWVGTRAEGLQWLPVPVFALILAAAIVYLGELASNTAMSAIFLPIAGASALAMGIDPFDLLLPVALAASVGFMLPVATPPNAIVFGYPSVTRASMLRVGAPLDVAGIVIVVALSSLLGGFVF